MTVLARTIRVAGAGVACAALLGLGGCQSPSTAVDGPAAEQTADPGTPATDEQGGTATRRGGSTPEVAEAYAACLTDHDVPATVVEGNRVVFEVPAGGSGTVTAGDPTVVEDLCRQQVPEYEDPDFDER